MSHLDRLALPICFIHGAENQCFLPVSTELTYNALRAANGNSLYSRHVIPGYGHIDCIYGEMRRETCIPTCWIIWKPLIPRSSALLFSSFIRAPAVGKTL